MEPIKIKIEIERGFILSNNELLKIVSFYNNLYNRCFNVEYCLEKQKTSIFLTEVEV